MKVVAVNKLEKSKVELEVEVSSEEFKAAVDKAARKMLPKIQINGFRKGKAPRHLVERQYGAEIFYEEAVNISYPEAYEAAVAEAKIEAINAADVEIIKIDKDGYTFKATVEVKPEVKLGKYKGIEVEKPAVKVTAADVNKELENIRARQARLVDISDRAAKDGDTVTIDYSGSVDGKKFDGGTAEKQSLKLGSGQFIPGFEEQVAGHKIGDSFDVNVTFPKEYHADELAGKDAVFAVTLHEIKETVLPTLDDEFIKDISTEFDTLKDYKADLKKKLTEAQENAAMTEVENRVIDKIVDKMKVDLPSVLVERQIDQMCQDFDYRLRSQGLDLENYLKFAGGVTIEQFRENFREEGEKRAKIRLALEEIIKLEKITIDEETLNKQYEDIAAQYGMEASKVKTMIPAYEIESDLAMNKAVNLVRDSAVIKTAEKKAETAAKDEKKPSAEKKPAAKKTTASGTAKKASTGAKTTAKKPAAKKTAETAEKKTAAKKSTSAAKKSSAKKTDK